MKSAIRIRNGENAKSPMMPKRTANPLPMSAAIWVARCRGIRPASHARSTLPPSMGNAGMRLKAHRMMLSTPRYPAMKMRTPAIPGLAVTDGTTYTSALQKIPKTRLVIGPTSAIGSSAFGSGTPSSIEAMPPKIMSVMLLIPIPFARATSEWASSCTRTPKKRPRATIVPRTYGMYPAVASVVSIGTW